MRLRTSVLWSLLLLSVTASHAWGITFDAGSLLQSTTITGNGDLLGPAGFAPASLPGAGTFTVAPTIKNLNVAGLSTLAPYVDMVKEPVFAFYRTTFSLPTGFSGISLDFEALFDNELQVFLNGSSIALDPTGLGFGCTAVGPGCDDFTAPRLPVSGFVMNSDGVVTNPGSGEQAFPFVSITQSLFTAGLNELIFVLGNSGGGTGDLGFLAQISFSDPASPLPDRRVPVPSTLVLIGLGLAVVGHRLRRVRRESPDCLRGSVARSSEVRRPPMQ